MKTLLQASWLLIITLPIIGQQISIEKDLSMLALGDSYTIGESVDTSERWPHQFVAELRALGVSAQSPDYIATSGWTTRNLLGWIQTKLPREKEYNLVSILIGVNNQYQGMDIASYEPDLRKIIDIALEIVGQDSTRVMILSIPDYAYTPFGGGIPNISQEIDAYNTIKRRVAEEYGIPYIYITDISREGLNNPSLVAADGLHPSKEQYARWVQAIIPRISLTTTLAANEAKELFSGTIQLYPNPAGSQVKINADLSIDRICVYNLLGQKVLEQNIKGLPARIDLGHLERGAYTLCAYQGDGSEKKCSILLLN